MDNSSNPLPPDDNEFDDLLPPTGKRADDLIQAFKSRHLGDPEEASRYVNVILDRQIAKASGLLTYNSVLFAGLQIDNSSGGNLLKAVLALSLFSSLIVLPTYLARWPSARVLGDPFEDAKAAFMTAATRSAVLGLSIYMSVFATTLALIAIAIR